MRKLNSLFGIALAIFLLGAIIIGCSKDKEVLQPTKYAGKTNLKADPIGNFDKLNFENNGLIRGWAADPDLGSRPVELHIYMGGPYYAGGVYIGNAYTGSVRRDDVRNVHPWAGYYAGFHFPIPPQHQNGYRIFYVYAINDAGNNPCIGYKSTTFTQDLEITYSGQFPNPVEAGDNVRMTINIRNVGSGSVTSWKANFSHGWRCSIFNPWWMEYASYTGGRIDPGKLTVIYYTFNCVPDCYSFWPICGLNMWTGSLQTLPGETNTSNNNINYCPINCTTRHGY